MNLNDNNQKCTNKDDTIEQFTLRNPNTNKLHICHCGCNVFTQSTDEGLYECNRCHTLWEAH